MDTCKLQFYECCSRNKTTAYLHEMPLTDLKDTLIPGKNPLATKQESKIQMYRLKKFKMDGRIKLLILNLTLHLHLPLECKPVHAFLQQRHKQHLLKLNNQDINMSNPECFSTAQ